MCFWNKDDADKVIEQSDILRQETTGGAVTVVSFPSMIHDLYMDLIKVI